MAKPFAKIITRRGFRRLAVIAVAGFVGLNVLAFMHARSMTHFVESGRRPLRPEEMSVGGRLEALLLGVSIPKPRNTTSPAEHGLAFDVLRFSTSSEVECEAWHVGCSGAKGICILFHGYASCKHELLDAAEAWHGLGYEALLVDFRGCGGSTGSETTIGYHEADDVMAAFDYVRGRWPELPPILYGRSMGSAAILRALAVHRVDPCAVVLECPFDRLHSAIANRCKLVGIPTFPVTELLIFWGGVQQGYSGFAHNPADYAARADCPVLMLQGKRDRRVTPEQAQAVFNNLRGPKQLIWFEESGHETYFDRGAQLWRRSIEEFLEREVFGGRR
jgi:hypothetical protein